MLVKIKRLTKATEKNQEGYYLNNLEQCIDDYIKTYNNCNLEDKIIKVKKDHIIFDLHVSEYTKDILKNPDNYRIIFHCFGQHDIDELSDDTMLVKEICKLEIRKVV